ncbi:MAG TPA: hypothetical protein P5136_00035 [Methanofastidiosum sp.]|nr:hypothetical protein [Methanofastidiosum sp.]
MDFILDLSVLNTKRYFVIGDLRGNYQQLIDILYEQDFNKDDTLIATGNIIDTDEPKSLDCIYFLMNCHNTYTVKGKREFDLINNKDIPNWLLKDKEQILQYLDTLPLIIKINDLMYVVNAGVEPEKSLEEQSPEVFYNIGKYDPDSRFYLFENPKEQSWYEFEFPRKDGKLIKYCFGGYGTGSINQPAGYDLGRSINDNNVRCLILSKGEQESPIIIET